MNCERVELKELTVERKQVKEVLKILHHSIVFQRALGEPRKLDVDSALFDISYVCVASRLVSQKVEDHAEAFWSAIESAPTVRVQSSIAFFERRSRPTAFGLFRSEEKVIWERWNIPLTVYSLDETLPSELARPPSASEGEQRSQHKRALEAALRERLEFILTMASGKKDHIPPVDGLGGDVPWFEISSNSSESWSGLDLFKQLLSSPPRPGL
mmetsp:Transcript_21570/g.46443  ORF Transcript_21570/g.46443 Transcript_21570/m.46443 type:complete len:213 (-) Transcript_21570:238-876(-)